MFKAPIKVLHPLLTATQEGNYNGTEGISALPFNGLSSPTRTNPNGSLSVITKTTKPFSTVFTS
ncbi:serine kinase family protein [Escherichia coli]|uniref:Serine kinase family protein n=1 Tax=Escherichia coli TaxID=562 RepID=A0A376U9U3_ECOLX|nr:serine kinase family protein [Escherichia coli]